MNEVDLIIMQEISILQRSGIVATLLGNDEGLKPIGTLFGNVEGLELQGHCLVMTIKQKM